MKTITVNPKLIRNESEISSIVEGDLVEATVNGTPDRQFAVYEGIVDDHGVEAMAFMHQFDFSSNHLGSQRTTREGITLNGDGSINLRSHMIFYSPDRDEEYSEKWEKYSRSVRRHEVTD